MLTPSQSYGLDLPHQVLQPGSMGATPVMTLHTSSRPHTLWLTGLSGSGKTTIAYTLKRRLLEEGLACHVLDGDTMRQGINRDLGFSEEHRFEAVRRVAECAKAMNDAGLIVIVSMISPMSQMREKARSIIGSEAFFDVYVDTPIEVCEQRDVKGLYKKARAGLILDFTGVNSAYEAPVAPSIVVQGVSTLDENVNSLMRSILERLG